MRQDAVVLKTFGNGIAEVAVTRGTACGSSCGNCESCIYQNELRAVAVNPIKAERGSRVIIESESSKVYRAEILVYIIPMLLLVGGYVAAMLAGAGEGLCVLAGFALMLIGVALVVFSQRKKKEIQFVIVRLKDD